METQGVIILQAQQSSLDLIVWTALYGLGLSSKQWPCTTIMPGDLSHLGKGKVHVMTYLGGEKTLVKLRSIHFKSVSGVCIDQTFAQRWLKVIKQ